MGLDAILNAGLPPVGRGLYCRDRIEPGFDFYLVNAWRTDAAAMCAQLTAAGKPHWLYGGLEHWRNDNALASLQYIVAKRNTIRTPVGIVTDPETLSDAGVLEALARGMAEAARSTRVGCTSFPMFWGLALLQAYSGPNVWFSPQIYGRTGSGAETFARWYALWTSRFGAARVIPSIAGWPSSDVTRDQASYDAYLASLPRSVGFIVWDDGAGIEPWRLATIMRYEVAGSKIGGIVNSALSWILRPTGIAVLSFCIAALVALVMVVRRA